MRTFAKRLLITLFTFLLIVTQAPAGSLGAPAGRTAYLPMLQNGTAPSSSGGFTFISWADTKRNTEALADLSRQAKKLHPVFTIFEGDLMNSGFTTTQIRAWTDAMNGGVDNGMFDIVLPVRGNHDEYNTSGWQSYFDMAQTARNVGARNFTSLATDLTYSFEYGNSIFIGIDVLGPSSLLSLDQIEWVDQVLTGAEQRGLTHAFIYFHGPVYTVGDYASCPTRVCDPSSRVASLIEVFNQHPIVTATFHGHEHVQAYVRMDSSRMPEITNPFEEFITGSAGSGPDDCNKDYRFDYCGSFYGFWTITVDGRDFTVKVYEINKSSPVKTFSFTK